MTTSSMAIINFISALCCLSAKHPFAASVFMEDAASVVQMAVLANDRPVLHGQSSRNALQSRGADDCEGEVQMNLDREVVTNNLGGQGPTGGEPVIHIRNFVDLMNGQTVDLVISSLTAYVPNNASQNGLKGEFNNINMAAGTTDFLFTFQDTATGAPVAMPAFNLTIYDLDGPKKDLYAETVAIASADLASYKLTASTDVTVTSTGTTTEFGSSAFGTGCDNPSTIESLGVVECEKSGTVDQRDRSVAVEMVGGQSSYHITLMASNKVKGRNFLFGLPASFDKVCPSPTPAPTGSPTVSPTASDSATSFGDPHVSNLKGERFDILQNDYHTFLVIPRGSTEQEALLYVVAKVDPLGELCSGLLFVTSLRFTGLWLGDVGSLEFGTSVQGPMNAKEAIKIKAGGSSFLNISEFKDTIPESLAEIMEFQPTEPRDLNQHVDTLLAKLKLGPTIAKVRMVYQKEKSGFSNSLWLTTSGMRHVDQEIGGILGLDDHTFAASSPKACSDRAGASPSLRMPRHHGSIHAAASFEDKDGGES